MSGDERLSILYVVSRFPTVTETFVVNEWLRMARRFRTSLVSLVRSGEEAVHPETREVLAAMQFVPSLGAATLRAHGRALRRRPGRYLRTVAHVVARSPRSPMGGRLKGAVSFWKAVRVAELATEAGVQHVHAHFANHPATAAWVVHRLTGLPYSFTAHANDLFAGPALLEEKLRAASFVAVISEYNRSYLAARLPGVGRVEVVHCGVDVGQLPFVQRTRVERLLCVGRLVETKGQADLLHAFASVCRNHPQLRLDLVGEGPDHAALRALVRSLGLDDRVRFRGVLSSEQVRAEMAACDVFVLAARPHSSGRMDGIPVALMEAMATGAPTVSTRLSGIPELVVDGVTGLLVDPGDRGGLANALRRLVEDPELRARLAVAARAHVEQRFDLEREVERLAQLVRSAHESDSNRSDAAVGGRR